MSLHGYHVSLAISAEDPPFESLLFALMHKADPLNRGRLQAAFPAHWAELMRRDRAANGMPLAQAVVRMSRGASDAR